jgi:hypothetical protein
VSTLGWIAGVWFVALFVVPLIGLLISLVLSRENK